MGKQIKLHNILYPIFFLFVIAAFLAFERTGIDYNTANNSLDYLPQSMIENKIDVDELEKECVILTDSTDEYSDMFLEYIKYIFGTISVGYDVVDVATEEFPDLTKYETSVCVFSNLDVLGLNVFTLTDWVKGGGNMMFLNPLVPTSSFYVIANLLGIHEGGKDYTDINGIKILTDFMIGGKGFEYSWEYPISVLNIGLSKDSIVHAQSDTGVPLLWERAYGEGKFVVNLFPSDQKTTRGMTVAAYSLLQDDFAYPVINASTFFIDDFPAPVPSGNNEYISKYYNRDIASFYSNVWWPDMIALSKKYGLKYTGLIIEQYTDETSPPYERYSDISTFTFFGSMLLNNDGELGYHGYNHQPLCFSGFDYKGELNYNTWKSEDDVLGAFNELISFSKYLFPNMELEVYVPPSNIFSDEAQKLLADKYPKIKTFSGIYIKKDYEYEQEFCVDEYGIINLPRILAGTIVDDFDKWLSLNELNYHYISSHFIHPDDALDEARGAEIGWEAMRSILESYIDWMYDVAPSIRNLTASDAAKAVQRYYAISLEREIQEDKYIIDIDNFYDEAYIIVRIRNGEPTSVDGGSLEKLGEELYLLKAVSKHVEIEIER